MSKKSGFKPPVKPVSKMSKPARSLTDSEYDEIFKSVIYYSTMEDTSSVASSKPVLEQVEDLGKPSTSQIVSELGSQKQSQLASQVLERESHKGSQFYAELSITCSASSIENFPTFRQGLEILERSTDGSEEIMPPLSQPPKHVSQRQRLMWLRDRRGEPIYVQCTDCHKWRYTNFDDPVDVPEKWTCCMNTGKEQNRCDIEEEVIPLVVDEDTIHNQYTAGSVVWAQMESYPWWPGIIDDCADTLQYYWLDDDMITPTFYHVVFFDKPNISRKWILTKNIISFKHHPNMDKNLSKFQRVLFGVRIEYAKRLATDASKYSVRERLFRYGFVALWKGEIKTPPPSSDDESMRSHSVVERPKKLVKRGPPGATKSSTSSKKCDYLSVSSDESVEATSTTRSRGRTRKAPSRRSSRSSNKYRYTSVSSADESVLSDTTDRSKKCRRARTLRTRSSRSRGSDNEIPLTQSSRYTATSSRYTDSQTVSANILRDHLKKVKQDKARNASKRAHTPTPNETLSITLNEELPSTLNGQLLLTPNKDLPYSPKDELSVSPIKKRAKINRNISADETPRSRYSSQRSSYGSIYDICSTDDSMDEDKLAPKQNAKEAESTGPGTSNNTQNNQQIKSTNRTALDDISNTSITGNKNSKQNTKKRGRKPKSKTTSPVSNSQQRSVSDNKQNSPDIMSTPPSRRSSVYIPKSTSPIRKETGTKTNEIYSSNDPISANLIPKPNPKKRGRKPKPVTTSPVSNSQQRSVFSNKQNSPDKMLTPLSRRSSVSIPKSRSPIRKVTGTKTNEIYSSNESIPANFIPKQNPKKRGRKPKSMTTSPVSNSQQRSVSDNNQNSPDIMSTPPSRRSSVSIPKSRSPIRKATGTKSNEVYSSNESITTNLISKQNPKKRGRKPKSVTTSPVSSSQGLSIFNSQDTMPNPRSRRISSNISKSRSPILKVTKTNEMHSSNDSMNVDVVSKQNIKKRGRKPKSATSHVTSAQRPGTSKNKQNSQEIVPTSRSRHNSFSSSESKSPVRSNGKRKDKTSKTQGISLESMIHPTKIKIEKEGKLVPIKTEPMDLPRSSNVKISTSKENPKRQNSEPFSDSLPLSQRSAPGESQRRKSTSSKVEPLFQQKSYSQDLEPFSETYEKFCERNKSAERLAKAGSVRNEDNQQDSGLNQNRTSKRRERSPLPIPLSQIKVENKHSTTSAKSTAGSVPSTSKAQGSKPRGRPKKFVPPTMKKEVHSTVAKLIADSDISFNMGDVRNVDPNDTLGSLQFHLDDD